MSLRDMAQADLAVTLADPAGFGEPIRITNPSGDYLDIIGQTGDIGVTMQPDTGIIIPGRRAHIAIRIDDVASLGVPVAIQDPTRKPWVVQFTGRDGAAMKTRVVESMPDRTLGLYALALERYQ